MPWIHRMRPGTQAPKDGSRFCGIARGRSAPATYLYDAEMGCFLSADWDMPKEISAWWRDDAPATLDEFRALARSR